MDVAALTILGTLVRARLEEEMVVHLDWVAPYQGAGRDEWP
jgi:hypothetical protein